ncbi:MAG: inositol monophosphatase [Anaerolineae bacterium]|nr:inositol monophosphatase [Anaerolineae bacterium]
MIFLTAAPPHSPAALTFDIQCPCWYNFHAMNSDAITQDILQTAIEAAHQAGQLLAERYCTEHNVAVKGYRDIVTEADTAAERVILDLIRRRFPHHAILSEEAGGDDIGNGYGWIIDPLDGTTNYAHHLPSFAVSIGVLKDSIPIVGVIYDPLCRHTFAAVQGAGATLNGRPLHVSRLAQLEGAVVGLDWGHSDEVREQVLSNLLKLAHHCSTVRAFGSATLALAYVAAGWLDVYLHLALKPWDVAAGILLVAEAGGRCTTPDGGMYQVHLPACLATNGALHEQVLNILNGRCVR